MPLHQADVLLSRARLVSKRNDEGGYPWRSPREDLAEARRLIKKHGYHRRDEELADAETAIPDGKPQSTHHAPRDETHG